VFGTLLRTRSYYDEGELVPGPPTQTLYYGSDQISSVRRIFATTTSAPAYSYDAYGAPLQATAPLTDFGYGGMLYTPDSGLYLTLYRAYDPLAGRWLSRDPIGEFADFDDQTDPGLAPNLYQYVRSDPVNNIDPLGLAPRSNPNPNYPGSGGAPGDGRDKSPVTPPPFAAGFPRFSPRPPAAPTPMTCYIGDTKLQDTNLCNLLQGAKSPSPGVPRQTPNTTGQRLMQVLHGVARMFSPPQN
jgi:RHS repeat-associated protein